MSGAGNSATATQALQFRFQQAISFVISGLSEGCAESMSPSADKLPESHPLIN